MQISLETGYLPFSCSVYSARGHDKIHIEKTSLLEFLLLEPTRQNKYKDA